jgi:CheY-like chemotaxis protein
VKTVRSGRDTQAEQRLMPLLYVEDNDDNWEVVKLRLSKSYAVLRASTDRSACEALAKPDDYYAILMDIELAGSRLNGIQLTRVLRGALPESELPDYARAVPQSNVPIIFVTAYGSAYKEQDLLATGADLVLFKPVNFTRLSLALANLYLNRISARRTL